MQELFIGETIRRKRLESGQTQEKLCEGLCDPSTLSRIENGKQTPSRNVLNVLLQRLGLPHDRYYAYLTASEAKASAIRSKIDGHAIQFQQSVGAEKQRARMSALEQLDKLESITGADDNITRQYVLAVRAAIGKKTGPYSLETRLDMLLKAIRLTVPQFNIETLDSRLYSIDETEIIRQIGETYSEAGQHKKAAGIFYQLLTYVREHKQDVTHPSRHLPPVALSYARELYLMDQYRDALKTAELGRTTCLDYGYCQALPGLLAVMAECRFAMGQFERSKELYYQAYYLYKETGNARGLAAVEEAAKEKLCLKFPVQGVLV